MIERPQIGKNNGVLARNAHTLQHASVQQVPSPYRSQTSGIDPATRAAGLAGWQISRH